MDLSDDASYFINAFFIKVKQSRVHDFMADELDASPRYCLGVQVYCASIRVAQTVERFSSWRTGNADCPPLAVDFNAL